MAQKNRLGRGLEALLGEADLEHSSQDGDVSETELPLQEVPIEWLNPSKNQPREVFDEKAIDELAVSVQNHGIIQPIIVVRNSQNANRYDILAGERRWRAAQIAGLKLVPVVIREKSQSSNLEVSIIENIQRVDLNPVEEAHAYRRLTENHGYTQQKVADKVGKSRPYVANLLRLLQLDDDILKAIIQGKLSEGHGRLLIGHPQARAIAKEAIELNWSVKELSNQLKSRNNPTRSKQERQLDADLANMEKKLSEALSLQVRLKSNAKGRGAVTINFNSLDQFEEISTILLGRK